MQDCTKLTTSHNLFPDEILLRILQYLTPCEVVRLRQVSKRFNSVSRDSQLWKIMYINARLPRPSGPYPWQSTSLLEHTLVHSDRISRTWTSQPIENISIIQGPRTSTPREPGSPAQSFLLGRLFIWYEGVDILAQDIETGARQVIWKNSLGKAIEAVWACPMDSPEGRQVIVALRDGDAHLSDHTPIKLLVFKVQDDSDSIRFSNPEIVTDLTGKPYIIFYAASPFLYFYDHGDVGLAYKPLVLDTRTWATYQFPEFSTNLVDMFPDNNLPLPVTWHCGRYIVVLRRWDLFFQPHFTLVQVFCIPDQPQQRGFGELYLIHEIVVEDITWPMNVLRNPVVDPVTGDVRLKFLGSKHENRGTRFYCVDFLLPRTPGPSSHSRKTLPMSIDSQPLFRTDGSRHVFGFQASGDGHGRGVVVVCPLADDSTGHAYDYNTAAVYRFSIDASEEKCTAAVSEPRRFGPEESQMIFGGDEDSFDAMSGRIYSSVERPNDMQDLVVISFC